jgi:hypothetical protein
MAQKNDEIRGNTFESTELDALKNINIPPPSSTRFHYLPQ